MISTVYKQILSELISIYEKEKRSIKGEEIAKMLNKTPGTIRNQMQTLRALGYVDGVPGPKGGYIPTLKAYEALKFKQTEYFVEVPIYKDNERIEGLIIKQITFPDVSDPTSCKSAIEVLGDISEIHEGSLLRIGPTPVNKIIIVGKVIGKNDPDKEILLETKSVTSIPQYKTGDLIANQRLISFAPDDTLLECEETLVKFNILSAPVIENDKVIGIVTLRDVLKAIVEKANINTVREIMETNIVTVSTHAQLADVVSLMKKYHVRSVIVIDRETEKPKGIISMTDIINLMIE